MQVDFAHLRWLGNRTPWSSLAQVPDKRCGRGDAAINPSAKSLGGRTPR